MNQNQQIFRNGVKFSLMGLVIITLFLVSCTDLAQNKTIDKDNLAIDTEDSIIADNQAVENQETMKNDILVGDAQAKNNLVLAGTTTQYLEFNQEDYETARSQNKIIILNFYANWCPLCNTEQVEAIAAFNQLNNPQVIGFRVNYKDSATDDDEIALARQFGISYQHTKVIIKNNERVLKATDSWDKERYITEINNIG